MQLIEDATLREMFRAESLEHAGNIETGLIELERSPQSTPLLDEVFREAHSLKGAARMLGLRDIQTLAHEIENLLDEARQGKIRITTAEVAPQLVKLDRIRALVAEAVGDPVVTPERSNPADVASSARNVETPFPSDGNRSAQSNPPSPAVASPALATESATPEGTLKPAPAPVSPQQSPALHKPSGDFRIDTLRVESSRLDVVFRLSAELLVSKGHISGWRNALDALIQDLTASGFSQGLDASRVDQLRAGLDELRVQVNADLARFESIVSELENGIRNLRLVPVSTLLEQFPRMVHDLALESGKQVDFRIEGASTVADKRIIEELKAPLMHLLRNSIDHGIELPEQRIAAGKSAVGQISVCASQAPDLVEIRVTDDGRGIDRESIRQQALKSRLRTEEELDAMSPRALESLILLPGFSTSRKITDVSGRGVGLDVVRASVERLRGTLTIESTPGAGTTMRLRLPVSLTATRAVLVHEWGQTYAIPAEDITAVRRITREALHTIEGRLCFYHDGQAVTPQRLGHLLERQDPGAPVADELQCVILQSDDGLLAINVDSIESIEELVIKPNAEPLARVRNVAGFAILNTGRVCVVLNPHDLRLSVDMAGRRSVSGATPEAAESASPSPRILLVEDSITTRTQEQRILEAAGYTVETAVDGVDALSKLARERFDAVVSDINMPRMSGLELTARIRADRSNADLPVVLVTSLATEADRKRGLDAGADAYIAKPEFDQTLLLDSLARLL